MRVPAASCLIATAGLLLGACHVPVITPEPLAGPAPRSIGIWPVANETAGPHAWELLEGLDRAVRARGYRVPSREVCYRILFDSVETAPTPTLDGAEGIGILFDVEALLVLEVRQFEAEGDPLRSASWDLQWRLLSTRGHGILWSHEHHGNWAQRPFADDDPLRPLDAEPDVVPIGGDRARSFRSVAELAAQLHQMTMAHLPATGPSPERPR